MSLKVYVGKCFLVIVYSGLWFKIVQRFCVTKEITNKQKKY